MFLNDYCLYLRMRKTVQIFEAHIHTIGLHTAYNLNWISMFFTCNSQFIQLYSQETKK